MNQIKFLTPANNPNMPLPAIVSSLKGQDNLPSFCKDTLAFVAMLSSRLLKDTKCKAFPELIALGFWLRKSNLQKQIKQQLQGVLSSTDLNTEGQIATSSSLSALGLVVHFTPANVDTMFIYSWVASLLMGNHNIVRVASKDSELQTLLLSIINELFTLPEHSPIASSNFFISFDKHGNTSTELCEHADARVIWGGDTSVAAILSYPAPEHCVDLCFADKFSVSIIAEQAPNQLHSIATSLWRDTQPYLQQACSSPRIVYWLKNPTESMAQSKNRLEALLASLEQLSAASAESGWHTISQANEHLVSAQQIMLSSPVDAAAEVLRHGTVVGLCVAHTYDTMLALHNGNGLFICKICEDINDAFYDIEKLNNAKLQTLSFHALSKTSLLAKKHEMSISGIDRIVPLGQALDFNFRWDGYDLLRTLSKVSENNAR